MHFHCAECGKQLRILTENEGAKKPKYHDDTFRGQEPKEPTGAACHYTPKISIVPCESCIKKYTAPAKKLCEALKELNDNQPPNKD
jgi:hypothetical protein